MKMWLGIGIWLVLIAAMPVPTDAAKRGRCDRIASPHGSDRQGAGTVGKPFRSPQRLLASLHPRQTGCFRGGRYRFSQARIATPDITLSSYGSERVSLRGAIKIVPAGAGTAIEGMRLNGRGGETSIGPKIYADDVVLRNNEITNRHADICVLLAPFFSRPAPRRVVIEHNRIHDCGERPSTNLDHGIYVSGAIGSVIRDNLIYDNADRGIQLYPAPQGTLITGNVIDGNGDGMVFSGAGRSAPKNNLVRGNIITNSRLSWNVRSGGEGPNGSRNMVTGNCLFASNPDPYFNSNGGIETPSRSFTATGNTIAQPRFRKPAADDFRLRRGSACLRSYSGTMALPGGPPPPHR